MRHCGTALALALGFLLPNGPDQWLAPKGLSTPLGFIASPLHRVVRNSSSLNQSAGYSLPKS
jgi:hypothetical protein